MRGVFAVSIAAIVLSACGKSEAPAAPAVAAAPTAAVPVAAAAAPTGPQQGAAESVAPDKVTIPAPVAAGQDVFAGLGSGGSATLRLDSCPPGFDAHAHLGSIMCGKDYKVFYEPATLRWVAIGPNADLKDGAVTGGKNPGPVPSEHIVVVWGLSFSVDPKTYKAAIGDGTVVGQLVHTAAKAQVVAPADASAPVKPAQ
jgi:hypothetical protein